MFMTAYAYGTLAISYFGLVVVCIMDESTIREVKDAVLFCLIITPLAGRVLEFW